MKNFKLRGGTKYIRYQDYIKRLIFICILLFVNISIKAQYKLFYKTIEDSIFCYKVFPYLTDSKILGLGCPEKAIEIKGLDRSKPISIITEDTSKLNKKNFISVIVDSIGKCRGVVFYSNIDDLTIKNIYNYFVKFQYYPAENQGKKINYWFTTIITYMKKNK